MKISPTWKRNQTSSFQKHRKFWTGSTEKGPHQDIFLLKWQKLKIKRILKASWEKASYIQENFHKVSWLLSRNWRSEGSRITLKVIKNYNKNLYWQGFHSDLIEQLNFYKKAEVKWVQHRQITFTITLQEILKELL